VLYVLTGLLLSLLQSEFRVSIDHPMGSGSVKSSPRTVQPCGAGKKSPQLQQQRQQQQQQQEEEEFVSTKVFVSSSDCHTKAIPWERDVSGASVRSGPPPISPKHVTNHGFERNVSVATSGGQYADATQTLVFLDWDDTIFPTTYVFGEWGVSTNMDHSVLPAVLVEELDCWRGAVERYFKVVCSVTDRCMIVTNSNRPWVHSCVQRFAPNLEPMLDKEAGIHIVYAGKVKKRHWNTGLRPVIRESVSDLENEFDDHLMRVKREAMQKAAREFYSRYPGQTWKNILSIGDMPYEHNAVQEMTFRRNSPSRERLRTKAITVPSNPSAGEVTFRLCVLLRLLPACVQFDGDLSLMLEAGQDHLKVVSQALDMPGVESVIFPDSAWGRSPDMASDLMNSRLDELEVKVQDHLYDLFARVPRRSY